MTTSPIDVLVVDDSADDANVMLLELQRAGYTLSAKRAETAAGFQAALAGRAWDVILCSDSVPDLDAQGALSLLRESGKDVPLIVVSGSTGEERAVELMGAGAADYLTIGRLTRLAPAVEREVRQAAGRRALRQARALVESSDDAIVSKTLDGIITSWNAGAERLYGYAADEVLGHSIWLIISPDRPDEEVDLLGRVARGERVEHYETERVRKDGTRVHVSVTLSPVRDVAGRVVGASTIARDVSDRKRAEQNLLQTSGLLRAVADGTPDAVYVKDRAGRYLLFNAAACRFVGKPVGDVLGRDDTALFSPADARWVMDRDRRIMESGTAETEEEVLTADGATRTYLATKAPYRDGEGNIIGLIGISHDMTDRKRAEESLREREALLETIITHIPCGVFWKDRDSILRGCNNQFAWDLGAGSPDDLIGKLDDQLVPSPEADAFVARDRRVMETGEPLLNVEESRSLADGRTTTLLTSKVPLRGPDGTVAGVLGVYQDITDRKRVEDALREKEARLAEAVRVTRMGYWNRDLATGDLDWSEELFDIFGVAPAAFTRTVEAFLECIIPDDRQGVRERITEAESSGKAFDHTYRVLVHGQVCWLHEVGRVVMSDDGKPYRVTGTAQDITEQKQADAAIRESEARYRGLADAMPQIVWVTGPDGYHDFYNRQWYEYTGLTVEQSKGDGWNSAFHPDDRLHASDGWRHALATGDPFEGEYRRRRHDGVYRWFLVRAVPQRDGAGQIIRWFGTATDIHDFKEAQADRYAALARLNLQVERMPLAYLLSGPDFRYTGWNPAAERTFGFSRSEALGRHPFDVVVPPQSRDIVAGVFARLAAGDMDAHGSCENVTKDGRTIFCEWYNTPLLGPDGSFLGVLSLAQDITARRLAEHALLLRDRAIRAVVGGIVITDATDTDNPITYVSPGFEHLTGYTGAEAIGQNCRFLQGKDTDRAVVADIRAAVRQGLPCDVELLNYLKDGTPFWNRLSISPVHDDAGLLTHFIGVQTDVTARRNLEEQFHQAQKMEAVGQLAGGVAHDFNNLLTVINGYGEILLDALPPDHSSRELVAEIIKAGQRAAGLTRQLLAFSRQSMLEPKVLDPNALVRDVERMLQRLIREDIELAAKLAPDVGKVKADPGQLEQAVVNLCVNASDAMPTGGKLTIETQNVELDAAYAATRPDVRPGPYVVLSVTDTGTGMTPEVQARIFEPFFTTKGVGKGTGLGLAMVFGFVKQSGGQVGVQSEVGQGTAFKLYLPRVAEAPPARKTGTTRTPMPRGTETVLLVEDEEAVRALGRHVLVMCGYTVLEAGNGEEAVRVADEHAGPLHILVTDVVMPGGMGGRQVAEAVVVRHPGAKVLFTSGYTDDSWSATAS